MGASGLSSRAIIGKFYHRLAQLTGASWVDDVSMLFDSNQESEEYKWLGMVPQMRQWIGGRLAKGLREVGITIPNLTFEATLEISADDLRRDKTGQLDVRISELARRTLSHWASLLSTLIAAGEAADCYDGQYFFDSDHSEGSSGTQTNDLTASEVTALNVSTATAPTAAEMAPAMLGVIGHMLTFKDDQGEPMNEDARSFIIMCGTQPIWQAASVAANNPVITDGSGAYTNIVSAFGEIKIRVVFNPRLSAWTTKFGVFRTDSDVRALIRQEEEPVKMDAIAEGSELEFENNVHHYGVKASRNVGYGYWQMAALALLS